MTTPAGTGPTRPTPWLTHQRSRLLLTFTCATCVTLMLAFPLVSTGEHHMLDQTSSVVVNTESSSGAEDAVPVTLESRGNASRTPLARSHDTDIIFAVHQLHKAISLVDTFENDKIFCNHQIDAAWTFIESDAPVSPALRRLLRQQRAMHLQVQSGAAPEHQKYVVWSLSGGLGNRFQSLVSTLLLAMLSGRVLLMKDWFTKLPRSGSKQTPVIFPSPLTDDYFLEDLSRLFGLDREPNDALVCPFLPMMSLTEYRNAYPREFDASLHFQHAKVDIAARHDRALRRWNRLLCSNLSESTRYAAAQRGSEVVPEGAKFGLANRTTGEWSTAKFFFPEKYIYIWTNQFYLPGLFANPFVQDKLRLIFPRGRPYTVLLSFVALPARPVMLLVRDFFRNFTNLQPGNYLALQVRAFQNRAFVPLSSSMEACAMKMTQFTGGGSFFVASMHQPVREYFTKKYGSRPTFLAPPRHEQDTGVAARDQEAFADMMILALAGRLIASPGSTFGSFVGALTGVPPVVPVVNPADGRVQCRTGGSQPCFAAWLWYDKLQHRGASGRLSCRTLPIPETVHTCEASG